MSTSSRTSPAKLIGVYSSRPQSGKSTFANRLVAKYGYESDRFAGPLKGMLRRLLLDVGYDADQIFEYLEGSCKEIRIPELGNRTARHLMQTLGTEWGRVCVSPTLWSDVAKAKIRNRLAVGDKIVIDDMRFQSEYEAIISLGGRVVRIEREADFPVEAPVGGHASEGALNGAFFHDIVLNDSTVARFNRMIDKAMKGLFV